MMPRVFFFVLTFVYVSTTSLLQGALWAETLVPLPGKSTTSQENPETDAPSPAQTTEETASKPILVEKEIKSLTKKPVLHKPKEPPATPMPKSFQRSLLVLQTTQGHVVGLWMNKGDGRKRPSGACLSALRVSRESGVLHPQIRGLCGLNRIRRKTVAGHNFTPPEPRDILIPAEYYKIQPVSGFLGPSDHKAAPMNRHQATGSPPSKPPSSPKTPQKVPPSEIDLGVGQKISGNRAIQAALKQGIPVVYRHKNGQFASFQLPYSRRPDASVMRCLYALEQMRRHDRTPTVCRGIHYATVKR